MWSTIVPNNSLYHRFSEKEQKDKVCWLGLLIKKWPSIHVIGLIHTFDVICKHFLRVISLFTMLALDYVIIFLVRYIIKLVTRVDTKEDRKGTMNFPLGFILYYGQNPLRLVKILGKWGDMCEKLNGRRKVILCKERKYTKSIHGESISTFMGNHRNKMHW